jgi:hypothetical protein
MPTSVGRDPFARGEYERHSHGPGECCNCGSRVKCVYSYVWVGDDNTRSTDDAHRRAKLFCDFNCFKSYHG